MDQATLISCGIDYQDGLRRCMGNAPLYERLLTQLLEDPSVAEAERHFSAGALDELSAAVHALKGVTGTLSVTPLYRLTSQMMTDLRAGQTAGLAAQMTQLRTLWDGFCAAVRAAAQK